MANDGPGNKGPWPPAWDDKLERGAAWEIHPARPATGPRTRRRQTKPISAEEASALIMD